DAGVVYGYGTDTNYDPKAGLEHELKSLNLMFSMRDIVKLMGPNTASYIEMSSDLGTLEAGKLADIVLLAGNPLEGYWNFLNPKLVIKGGVVVSDQRGPVGKRWYLTIGLAILGTLLMQAPLGAQWIRIRSEGIPRLAN